MLRSTLVFLFALFATSAHAASAVPFAKFLLTWAGPTVGVLGLLWFTFSYIIPGLGYIYKQYLNVTSPTYIQSRSNAFSHLVMMIVALLVFVPLVLLFFGWILFENDMLPDQLAQIYWAITG